MNEFEITWIKNPVEDILGIGNLELVCEIYCSKKTPDTCGTYCLGHTT